MRALFPYKFVADLFSKHELQLQKDFSGPTASTKNTTLFQNPSNRPSEELPPNLQLKVTDNSAV